MTNLKISNEVRLVDLIVLIVLAIVGFSLYYHSHANEVNENLKTLNTKIDNLDKFLREPIDTEFKIKK